MAVVDILIFVYRPDPRPDFQDGLFLLEILLKVNMYSGCPSVINNGLMIQYGKGNDTTNLSSFIFQIGAFGNRNFETNVVISYITIGF